MGCEGRVVCEGGAVCRAECECRMECEGRVWTGDLRTQGVGTTFLLTCFLCMTWEVLGRIRETGHWVAASQHVNFSQRTAQSTAHMQRLSLHKAWKVLKQFAQIGLPIGALCTQASATVHKL